MRLSIKKRWVLEDGARRPPSYLSLPSSYMDNSSKFVFKKMREAQNRLLKTQQYYLNRSSGYCIFLQSWFGFDTIFFKVGLDLVCNYVNVGLDLIPIFVNVGLDLMQFSSKVGLDLKIMCIFVLDIKVFRYV